MSNSKKTIREQATQLITKSNDSFEKFKQFLFAPNLLTFVISVVVGNSFGSTIKELVNFIFGIFKFVQFFLLSKNNTIELSLITKPFSSLFTSLSTTLLIAAIVFYTIRLINNSIISDPENKWGYNQQHADAVRLQKQNEEAITLQKEILSELKYLNKEQYDK